MEGNTTTTKRTRAKRAFWRGKPVMTEEERTERRKYYNRKFKEQNPDYNREYYQKNKNELRQRRYDKRHSGDKVFQFIKLTPDEITFVVENSESVPRER